MPESSFASHALRNVSNHFSRHCTVVFKFARRRDENDRAEIPLVSIPPPPTPRTTYSRHPTLTPTLPREAEKAFSLPVNLARWRLADLPRLLAVDSRLSDRTVVRSRRELRPARADQTRLDCTSVELNAEKLPDEICASALKSRALLQLKTFKTWKPVPPDNVHASLSRSRPRGEAARGVT